MIKIAQINVCNKYWYKNSKYNMRFREILSELKLDIPDQMVSVQVPLSTIKPGESDDNDEVVNPGKRAGENGDYKWSPPLQQQLDMNKDAMGVSNEETNEKEAEVAAELEKDEEKTENSEIDDLKKKIAFLLSQQKSPLN